MCGGRGDAQEAAEHHHHVGRGHDHEAQGGGHGGDPGAHCVDDSLAEEDEANLGTVRLDREEEEKMKRHSGTDERKQIGSKIRKEQEGHKSERGC